MKEIFKGSQSVIPCCDTGSINIICIDSGSEAGMTKMEAGMTISILALCIGIFFFWYLSKPVVAAWFDDNWLYKQSLRSGDLRKAITVTVTSDRMEIV